MKEEVFQSKVVLADRIRSKIENSHSIVLVNYRGLNVEEVIELYTKYHETGIDCKVCKDTTVRRTFGELGYEEIGGFLRGPSAITFSTEDSVSPAKIATDSAKDHKVLEVKTSFVDGVVINQEAIEDLVELPSKEEPTGEFLDDLDSPSQGMVGAVNGTLEGFVVTLNTIAGEKKGEGTA